MAREGTDKSNMAFPRCRVEDNTPAGRNPGREKGSRTVNVTSRTPTSIQDSGKSTFGSLDDNDQDGPDTGPIDPGKGKGF